MSRKQLILRAQLANARLRLEVLPDPPGRLSPAQAAAWRDAVREMPIPPTTADSVAVEIIAIQLAAWRARPGDRERMRELYRWLADFFVPMSARRRLLFPDRAPKANGEDS